MCISIITVFTIVLISHMKQNNCVLHCSIYCILFSTLYFIVYHIFHIHLMAALNLHHIKALLSCGWWLVLDVAWPLFESQSGIWLCRSPLSAPDPKMREWGSWELYFLKIKSAVGLSGKNYLLNCPFDFCYLNIYVLFKQFFFFFWFVLIRLQKHQSQKTVRYIWCSLCYIRCYVT